MIYYELLEDGTIGRSTNSEKVAQMNGYYNENQIVEYEDEIFFGNDGKRYLKKDNLEEFNKILDKEILNQKLNNLTNWFDTYFKMQLEQHSWQKNYKPSVDPYFKNEDGSAKTYEIFEDVIAQAELVREEIKQLRNK